MDDGGSRLMEDHVGWMIEDHVGGHQCYRRTGSATGLCVLLRLTVDQRLSKPDFLIIEFNLTPSKRVNEMIQEVSRGTRCSRSTKKYKMYRDVKKVCEESFKSASRLRLHEAACKNKKLKRCYELAQENKTIPSRGREEREKFTVNKKIANGLNESAKESDSPLSYSVRDNLEIRKFERKAKGKWSKVEDWKLATRSEN
ncbi:hypothetical protein CAPTEDRAFT_210032 [Capitella teleta]|uniref:Uncharacterized protein n=1 Tax=Capitella teleta TaxID=283909 RepID=R7V083_CAPTE|nr:hypothetical protein CAPTEDRAFT_210032 [Capitella teleta]|eukprot:ELU11937.1 hypothetical protein CAPTEDRAFT_210032 [Capitella teleta]